MTIQSETSVRVRLPTGGWQVGFLVQSDGRTALEIMDPDGSPCGLVVNTDQSVLSIDEGMFGCACGPYRRKQWWALAVGRAPVRTGHPTVTFTRMASRSYGGQMTLQFDRVDGLWVAYDGLWIAATLGRYTHVWLSGDSEKLVRRLRAA